MQIHFPRPMRRGVLSGLVMGCLALACGSSKDTDGDGPGDGDGSDAGDGDTKAGDPWQDREGGVFVHLFEWPWPDVAQECEEVLGPAGFTAVQVSPPSEHARIGGRPWWERYQPVSYELVSRSGDREEFADMVARCAHVGVDIFVDAVLNHMSAQTSGTGTAGNAYQKYEFPDYGAEDFHSPPCEILGTDYQNDASRVQECELLGLSDLNTSLPRVQARLAEYLEDLVNLGVRGFRIDAAKHMAPEDIQGILDGLFERTGLADRNSKAPYVFLEVIDHGGEAVSEADYAGMTMGAEIVGTTEFRYGALERAFRSPLNLTPLAEFDDTVKSFMNTERAVVFTDNHDTQRGDALSYRDGERHTLANVFMLGFPYGYAQLMSSFSFNRPGGEANSPPHLEGESVGPHDERGQGCVVSGASDEFDREELTSMEQGRWICEHRDRRLIAMLRFRRATLGTEVSRMWSGSTTSVAYAREGTGYVLINAGQDALSERLSTGMPEGMYCNLLQEKGAGADCAVEDRVHVDALGEAEFSVPPLSAFVLLREDES